MENNGCHHKDMPDTQLVHSHFAVENCQAMLTEIAGPQYETQCTLSTVQHFSVRGELGSWLVKLTEDSCTLVVFKTVLGRRILLYLGFGVILGQSELQTAIYGTYEGIKA